MATTIARSTNGAAWNSQSEIRAEAWWWRMNPSAIPRNTPSRTRFGK